MDESKRLESFGWTLLMVFKEQTRRLMYTFVPGELQVGETVR